MPSRFGNRNLTLPIELWLPGSSRRRSSCRPAATACQSISEDDSLRGFGPQSDSASMCSDLRLRPASTLGARSEEHTSELQSLMRISSAVFCLPQENTNTQKSNHKNT